MNIRPLILVTFGPLSGGIKRTFEILKRGKSNGIDYVIVLNKSTYHNAKETFRSLDEVLSQYRLYVTDWGENPIPSVPGNSIIEYKNIINSAHIISVIAKTENVDLIVSPSEEMLFMGYLAGILSRKPWTATFQLMPIIGYHGSLVTRDCKRSPWSLANQVLADVPIYQRIGLLWNLFACLKVSEKAPMLTVSESIEREVGVLDSRIRFHVIEPGCGIDTVRYGSSIRHEGDEAIFFARLIPEKGLLDLPEVWKIVTKRIPDAKLIVPGIVQDQKWISVFNSLVKKYGLSKNIIFVGQQPEEDLIRIIKSCKVFVYPSMQDAFPLSVLESLVCGTPVVAYDYPAMRYNFRKCEAVIRVGIKDNQSMASQVIRLLENEEEWSRLSLEAMHFARQYDWNRVTKAEKDAYVDVVNSFTEK